MTCGYCNDALIGPTYCTPVDGGMIHFCDRLCCNHYVLSGYNAEPKGAQRTVRMRERVEPWSFSIREWLYD